MRRREFITVVGGAALTYPTVAHAQPTARLPIIGFMSLSTSAARSQLVATFLQRLRDLGWIEGRTIKIELRWAEGSYDRLTELVTELIRLKVDVIVADGGTAAAKQATSSIPIVFPVAGDPTGMGFVASLARPGGNVTGLSNQAADLGAKRLELLREVVPNLRRLVILANAGYSGAQSEVSDVRTAADTLGVEVAVVEIKRADDISPAFRSFKGRAEALYAVGDVLIHANRVRINTLALAAGLPTMYVHREYVEAGGLMSYGANLATLFRRSADFVDRILRGAKPADIPVEQPTKFDFVINLITAEALGLTISPMLLARADEVIE